MSVQSNIIEKNAEISSANDPPLETPAKAKPTAGIAKIIISSIVNTERAIHSKKELRSTDGQRRSLTREGREVTISNFSGTGIESRCTSSEKKFHRKVQSMDKKQLEYYKRKLMGDYSSFGESDKRSSQVESDKVTFIGGKGAIISSLLASMSRPNSNSRFVSLIRDGSLYPEIKNVPNIMEYRGEQDKTKLQKAYDNKLSTVTKFLSRFPDLGKNSQILTDISARKWEGTLKECIEVNQVNKFLELQKHRMSNIISVYDSFLLPQLENCLHDDSLLDVLRLLFADLNNTFLFYDEMLKRQWKNAINVQEVQKRKGESSDNEDFLEGLDTLLLKMNPYLDQERRNNYFETLKEPLRKCKLKLKLEETPRTDRYLKIVNELDEFVECIYSKMYEGISENATLLSELEKTKTFIGQNILLSRSETEDIFNSKTKSVKPPPPKHRFSAIDEMTQFYNLQINELTALNEKLQKDLAHQKKKLENFLNFHSNKEPTLSMYEDGRALFRDSIEGPQSKGVQVDLFPIKQRRFKVDLLAELEPFLPNDVPLSEFKFSKETTQSIINLVLSNKLLKDYGDHLEKRRRKSMYNYIFEWFFLHFGNQAVAMNFLKDFLNSLQALAPQHERFEIFAKMCGIPFEIGKQHYTTNEKYDFRRRYYGSSEAPKLYLKFAYRVRFILKDKSLYNPLLPNIFNQEDELINTEKCLQIIREILKEDGVEEAQLNTVAENFGNLVVADIYIRQEKYQKRQGKTLDRNLVRFDYVAKYLIDYFAENNSQKLDQLCTGIKLAQTSRIKKDVFYEDFLNVSGHVYRDKTKRWQELCFVEYIFRNKELDGASVNAFLYSIFDWIICPEPEDNFYVDLNTVLEEKPVKNDKRMQGSFPERSSIMPRDLGKSLTRKGSVNMSFSSKILKLTGKYDDDSRDLEKFLFEVVNSIILLEDCYEQFKETIKKLESTNDNLLLLHDSFKKEVQKLPKGLKFVKKNFDPILTSYNRMELVEKIQSSWKSYRLLCDTITSKKFNDSKGKST